MEQQLFIIFSHGMWGQCQAFSLLSIGSNWLQFMSLLELPMTSRNLCIFWHSELPVIFINLCNHSWILLFIGLETFYLLVKCNSEAFEIYIYIYTHTHTHTGCPRRKGQNFGGVFLMLKYTDITQNTYIQNWTVTEIMAREKCGLLAGLRTAPCQLT